MTCESSGCPGAKGEFWMDVEGRRHQLGVGQTLHIPADAVHAGGNSGEAPGRRIIIFSPAGMERFFTEAGAADPQAEIDPAAVLAAARRHGWEFLPPPGNDRGPGAEATRPPGN